MRTYEIKEMSTGKFNIYYYIDDVQENVELYSYADKVPLTEIKQGYKLK